MNTRNISLPSTEVLAIVYVIGPTCDVVVQLSRLRQRTRQAFAIAGILVSLSRNFHIDNIAAPAELFIPVRASDSMSGLLLMEL